MIADYKAKGRRGIGFENQTGPKQMTLSVLIALIAIVLAGSIATALGASPSPSSDLTPNKVETLALEWFAQMQSGQIDRTQLTTEYSTHLTDDAVEEMSKYLKEYKYGASPTGAQVLKNRTIGEQTFYVVKLVFPRGDAASLLLGVNADHKITGISLMSMAGD